MKKPPQRTTVYIEEVAVRNSGKRDPGPHFTIFERAVGEPIVRMRTSHGHTIHLPVQRLKEIVAAL